MNASTCDEEQEGQGGAGVAGSQYNNKYPKQVFVQEEQRWKEGRKDEIKKTHKTWLFRSSSSSSVGGWW